jgi:HAD superfamily hydrolase (TIGR01549 family)
VTAARLEGIAGITFDFGNTLVRVDRASLHSVVAATAATLVREGSISDASAFLDAWAAERDRQFRLQVPQLLEVDLSERVRHVFAGLRGAVIPASDAEPWDEPAVTARVDAAEVAFAVETYSQAFVDTMTPLPSAEPTLRAAHAAGFRLGVLSNWPLAVTVDRYVEAQGWSDLFRAIVVSQRVGVIKPHRGIFAAAEAAMGLGAGELLHVGDDWAADVVGAREAGWRVAYLRGHQGETPLPTSSRHDGNGSASTEPDLELDSLTELLPRLVPPALAASPERATATP